MKLCCLGQRRSLHFRGVLLVLLCFSCASREPSIRQTLQEYGVRLSIAGQVEVRAAVALANAIIPEAHPRLTLFNPNAPDLPPNVIPVVVAQPEGLPLHTVAQRLEDERFVVVPTDWKPVLIDLLEASQYSVNEFDTIGALAIILLHELGHIANTCPSPLPEQAGQPAAFALADPVEMNKELCADGFFATLLRSVKGRERKRLEECLINLEYMVDYNYNARYGFHGSPLSWMVKDPKKQYIDHTYSHPNLRLRFILMAFLVDPTPERRERLERFVAERKRWASTQ